VNDAVPLNNDRLPIDFDNRRLVKLIIAHGLLCALPALASLASIHFPPVLAWIMQAPLSGTVLTIAFWLGMGSVGFFLRLLLATIGVFVIQSATLLLTLASASMRGLPIGGRFDDLLPQTALFVVYVVALSVGFLVARIWYVVVRTSQPDDSPKRDWFKFSVLHLLVAMSLCGVATTLLNVARTMGEAPRAAAIVATLTIIVSVFFANTFLTALAALGPRPLWPRILAVLAVSVLLGLVLSYASRFDQFGTQFVLRGSIMMVSATVVVTASLLVTRSCGFRLVRRSHLAPTTLTAGPFEAVTGA
jgi:hypothetical protein